MNIVAFAAVNSVVAWATIEEVFADLTKAIDYGIVKLAINDGEPKEFDRFNRGVAHDKLLLGTMTLPQGVNRLTVTIAGANENAVKRYMFGLDYLQLVPAK